jgi:hypothetical protein
MSPLYRGWIYAAAVAAPGDKSALVAALRKKRFAIAGCRVPCISRAH